MKGAHAQVATNLKVIGGDHKRKLVDSGRYEWGSLAFMRFIKYAGIYEGGHRNIDTIYRQGR